jgi:predicted nucleotidyltransferase
VDRAFAQRLIADYFRNKPGIAAVYLFGSVAKGTSRADSDVDVGIIYAAPIAQTLMAQPFAEEAELAERFARPVQVIIMNQAPPDLVHRILRDGVLVLDLDRSRRIAFEVRSRNEYFDLLPILREYRKQVRNSAPKSGRE